MPLHRLTFSPEAGFAALLRCLRPAAAGLVIGLLPGVVHAQATGPDQAAAAQSERNALRARIAAERQVIQQRRSQQEKACYQRFAVEDCLREVRTQARTDDNVLRRQDLEISDFERREKSANRLRSIEQKSQEPRSKAPVDGKARTPRAAPAPAGAPADAGTAQDRADASALRAQQARERAQSQSQHQQSHAAELLRKQSTDAERRTAARQRHEDKQRQAQEHKQRQQAKSESQAERQKPAPLPLIPGAVAP